MKINFPGLLHTSMKIKKFKKYVLRQLAFLLLISVIQPLAAQQNDLRFEHLSWEDGLSQVTVRATIQDSRGFMWFATDDGLNKFNGYDFTVYRHNTDDPGSISSNRGTRLFEDSRGLLWIGTLNGLNSFDRNTETFRQYYHNPKDTESLSSNHITSIVEDQNGTIWIGTVDGLNKFDRENGAFLRYKGSEKDSSGLNSDYIHTMATDKSGNLWIGTQVGLSHLNLATQEFTHYTHQAQNPNSLSHSVVTALFINKQGLIWVGTQEGGLNSFDPATQRFTRYPYYSDKLNALENYVYSVSQDKSGKVWIGTNGGGVFTFHPAQETTTQYLQNEKDPYSISDNTIVDIYTDKSGFIWFGTQTAGINKVNSKGQKFGTYQQNPHNSNSLLGNNIWGVLEDRSGLLWIATDQGLNNYDKKTEEWTHYTFQNNKQDALNGKSAWSIFEDKSGGIWVGTGGGGLSKFSKASGTFTHYMHDPDKPNTISHNSIWKVTQDKEGHLWIATLGGGLNKFNKETETFTRFKHDPDNDNSLDNGFIWSIHIDQAGIIWLGTNGGGLNKLDPKTGKFTHYVPDHEAKSTLTNNYTYSIHEDKEGALWAGTSGGGLQKFDKKTGTFKVYQEKDGLINNVIYAVLEDDNGHLWLSTNKGLSRFNPDTEEFKNYDSHDGLQSNEFNTGAYFKNAAGELFFGGINGLNFFHPDSIKSNTEVPPIVITDLKIFNKPVQIGEDSFLQKHISQTDELTLSYKQSVVSFEFVALNYISPEKNQYAYMLEGFDKDWYHVGNRRFATYTNIPPGTYTFRVKGSNNDGVWNEEGTSIKLTIVPPFWQTKWFYLIVVVSLVILVVGIFQFRLSALRRAQELLKQQVNERTKELSQEKERVQKQNMQLNSVNEELTSTLDNLQSTQMHLVQSEKMASLGQLTAGVAHEINNPVNFISAGIDSMKTNYEDIIDLLNRYSALKENGIDAESLKKIEAFEREIELDDLLRETNQLIKGIKEGAVRTKEIVKSLQNFSRLDENNLKKANINEGIESTLLILQSSFADRIEVIKEYGSLPEVDCYPGQVNQVFMNILSNAIQAIEGKGTIQITTSIQNDCAVVKIKDSGKGIPPEIIHKIFDPFFTTKDVGEGTGLGLSISYGIIKKHNGKLYANSSAEEGTTFVIELPLTLEVEKDLADLQQQARQ